jgi:uncharacterized protein (TIGR02246 family)
VNLDIQGTEVLSAPERAQVLATLGALFSGFAARDAQLLKGVYSDDADWVNAFGSVKKGSREIVGYLEGLFADKNFNAGRLAAPPKSRLRRLTNDIATVSTHLQIQGQGLVGGGEIKLRDNHSLRVLQKQAGGRWLIVSEIYMDARQEQSYAGHS